MPKPNYKYKCWFQKTGSFSGKYRLQVFEPGKNKEYLYVQNWNFENPAKMLEFIQSYFPDIEAADWESAGYLTAINVALTRACKIIDFSHITLKKSVKCSSS